jgi:hypothetical protein
MLGYVEYASVMFLTLPGGLASYLSARDVILGLVSFCYICENVPEGLEQIEHRSWHLFFLKISPKNEVIV